MAETARVFSRFGCFPTIASWNRWNRPTTNVLCDREREVEKATAAPWLAEERKRLHASGGKAYRDHDHSAPDWDESLKLGFPGLAARVNGFASDTPFYLSAKQVAAAILHFLDRLHAAARRKPRSARRARRSVRLRGATAARGDDGTLGVALARYTLDANVTETITVKIRVEGRPVTRGRCHLVDEFNQYTEVSLAFMRDGTVEIDLRPNAFAYIELPGAD